VKKIDKMMSYRSTWQVFSECSYKCKLAATCLTPNHVIQNYPKETLTNVIRLSLIFLLALFSIFCTDETKAEDTDKERLVKAVMISKLPLFIRRDAKSTRQDNDTLTYCVISESFLVKPLQIVLDRGKQNSELLTLDTAGLEKTIGKCELLLVGETDDKELENIFQIASRHHVLTVSEVDRFAHRGGMVGLSLHEGKVKVEINNQRLREAGIVVSAKLLELAQMVN
jgi:uncharacterized protein DUF4154